MLYSNSQHPSPSQQRLPGLLKAQAEDYICNKLIMYYKSGWPPRPQLSGPLQKYWQSQGELSLCNDLLIYNSRIVVPQVYKEKLWEKSPRDTKGSSDATLERQHQSGGQGFPETLKTWSRHVTLTGGIWFLTENHYYPQTYHPSLGKR